MSTFQFHGGHGPNRRLEIADRAWVIPRRRNYLRVKMHTCCGVPVTCSPSNGVGYRESQHHMPVSQCGLFVWQICIGVYESTVRLKSRCNLMPK